MEDLRLWAPIVVAMLALVTTWVVHLRAARRTEIAAVEGQVSVLKDDVDGLEERMARMDSRLDHMPDKDVSHRLEMAIARLEGRLETMDERLKPVAAMANRVHERMFEEAAR